jgi:hypothetical protein
MGALRGRVVSLACVGAVSALAVASCSGGGSLEASTYGQRCMIDADCVMERMGPAEAVCCDACDYVPISASAVARYQADEASLCGSYHTPCPPGPQCGSPPRAACSAGGCVVAAPCPAAGCPDAASD